MTKKSSKESLNNAFAMATYNMLAQKANRENLSDEEFKKLVKDFLSDIREKIEKIKQLKQLNQLKKGK